MFKPSSTKFILSSAIAAFLIGNPVFAENLGIILSNPSYRKQLDLRNGPDIDRIEAALQAADFSTIMFQNMGLNTTADRMGAIKDRMDGADRLVVVINGHVVTSLGGAWLLEPQAGSPNSFDIGSMAFPVAPLLDAAARHPGASLVAIVTQTRDARIGFGVDQGATSVSAGQGVTLATGTAGNLSDFFENGFLEAGRSMADALRDNPGVTGSGYIPSLSAFIPSVAMSAVEGEIIAEPEPVLTPEERNAAIEADMGLNRNERRDIQRNLAILGFDPGGIDGLLGRGSRRAIGAYQADRDFEVTGYLSEPMVDQLSAEAIERSRQLEKEARERQAEADARDTQYWRDTGQAGDEAGLRAYLRRYPDGLYAEIATSRLDVIEEARAPVASRSERRFWDRVKEENSKEGYEDYLAEYPDGAFASDARKELDDIQAAAQTEADNRKYLAAERSVAGNSVARKLVENRLAALGLNPGRVDGEFDNQTRAALREFQRARKIEPTGYVNQATMVRILIGK